MKTAFYLWLAAGVALLVFYLWSNAGNKGDGKQAAPSTDVDGENAAKPSVEQTERADEKEEMWRKGREFEEFVISLMPKDMKLVHRTADYSSNGVYAEENSDPDLSFAINDQNGQRQVFAVECKWRASWRGQHVDWTYDKQLARYQQFSKDKDMPVFIALGIGNSPSDPEELYLVPLTIMKQTYVKKGYITKYRRKTTSAKLNYDPNNQTLR